MHSRFVQCTLVVHLSTEIEKKNAIHSHGVCIKSLNVYDAKGYTVQWSCHMLYKSPLYVRCICDGLFTREIKTFSSSFWELEFAS